MQARCKTLDIMAAAIQDRFKVLTVYEAQIEKNKEIVSSAIDEYCETLIEALKVEKTDLIRKLKLNISQENANISKCISDCKHDNDEVQSHVEMLKQYMEGKQNSVSHPCLWELETIIDKHFDKYMDMPLAQQQWLFIPSELEKQYSGSFLGQVVQTEISIEKNILKGVTLEKHIQKDSRFQKAERKNGKPKGRMNEKSDVILHKIISRGATFIRSVAFIDHMTLIATLVTRNRSEVAMIGIKGGTPLTVLGAAGDPPNSLHYEAYDAVAMLDQTIAISFCVTSSNSIIHYEMDGTYKGLVEHGVGYPPGLAVLGNGDLAACFPDEKCVRIYSNTSKGNVLVLRTIVHLWEKPGIDGKGQNIYAKNNHPTHMDNGEHKTRRRLQGREWESNQHENHSYREKHKVTDTTQNVDQGCSKENKDYGDLKRKDCVKEYRNKNVTESEEGCRNVWQSNQQNQQAVRKSEVTRPTEVMSQPNSSKLKWPRYITSFEGNSFVVSDHLSRVVCCFIPAEYDPNTYNCFWTYEEAREVSHNFLARPRGICSNEDGQVVVTDPGCDKLLLISRYGLSDGELLAQEDGIQKPYCVASKGDLMAVGQQDGTIKVYKVIKW